LQQWAAVISKDCWRFLPKTLSGSFRASGRWSARTADTRDWRICFRRLPKWWTSYPEPPEFVAQGGRVLVVGFATGRVKATNRTFEDNWVFAITVRNGKVTNIREYIDTLALARAFET
jgi:ketosteroid isomerase-like protein